MTNNYTVCIHAHISTTQVRCEAPAYMINGETIAIAIVYGKTFEAEIFTVRIEMIMGKFHGSNFECLLDC